MDEVWESTLYTGFGDLCGAEIVKSKMCVTLLSKELIANSIIELKFKHEFEGEEYITFEAAKLQNPDKFGRDLTVYCTTREEVEDEKPLKKSPNQTKLKTLTFLSDEIFPTEVLVFLSLTFFRNMKRAAQMLP